MFYFKNSQTEKIIFKDVMGVPINVGILGYDVDHNVSLQFRIVKKDGQLSILKEDYED